MREIKFRAWDKKKKEMRTVTSLNFYDEYMWVDETPMTGERLPIEGTPLMQYTGLKDKNGKEIYEGDVLKTEQPTNNRYLVVYDDKEASFRRKLGKDNWYFHKNHKYEVIGNIYENPELIKTNK